MAEDSATCCSRPTPRSTGCGFRCPASSRPCGRSKATPTSKSTRPAPSKGFLGIELVIGARDARRRPGSVQSPGRFARLDAHVFLDVLECDPSLRDAARRYAAAVQAIRGQWVACNARHTIEQRLAKWLLSTRDRVGDEIQITQDIVAMMLGVRRASVVTVLGRFVDDGLVAHGYARVRIVDAARLAAVSCSCYARAAELLRAGLSRPHRNRPSGWLHHLYGSERLSSGEWGTMRAWVRPMPTVRAPRERSAATVSQEHAASGRLRGAELSRRLS